MKKFILFFLIFLLLVGTGSLAFGFWNGKRIRNWAASASEIKFRHNISAKEKKFEERFGRDSSSRDTLKSQSDNFVAELEKSISEANAALNEVRSLPAPRAAQQTKKDLEEYYNQNISLISDLKSIIVFKTQLLEVANIIDSISDNNSLEDIEKMIVLGKEKSSKISIETLPQEMQSPGSSLKAALDRDLDIKEQYVTDKIQNSEQLMASYADLARQEEQFSIDQKKYINSLTDPDLLLGKINAELAALENVKFDLR